MAANTGKTIPLNLPFALDERGDQNDGASVKVSLLPGNRTSITLEVDHSQVRDVLDRWTWNSGELTIRSGDKLVSISFPKIGETSDKR